MVGLVQRTKALRNQFCLSLFSVGRMTQSDFISIAYHTGRREEVETSLKYRSVLLILENGLLLFCVVKQYNAVFTVI